MEIVIAVCGFIGSWLLVAGPVYQAALELKDEGLEREHVNALRGSLPPPKPVSAWWWLLPPVKLLLERQSNKEYRQRFIAALPSEDVAAMVSFISKAGAWLTVSGGGLLLAINETYQFAEKTHLSLPYFWLIVSALAVASVANTAYRMAIGERLAAKGNG